LEITHARNRLLLPGSLVRLPDDDTAYRVVTAGCQLTDDGSRIEAVVIEDECGERQAVSPSVLRPFMAPATDAATPFNHRDQDEGEGE
jgi:hypothetical protein